MCVLFSSSFDMNKNEIKQRDNGNISMVLNLFSSISSEEKRKKD